MFSLLQEEQAFKEREFQERLATETFDDFDYLVEEVRQKPISSTCE